MALVFQIVVALASIAGLVTAILTIKNWHWAQMVLALAIWLSAIGALLLGLEVYRIHRNIRAGMPKLEQQLTDVQAEQAALKGGTRDAAVIGRIAARQENGLPFDQEKEGRLPGISVWEKRLQDLDRQRGRVWRGVKATGPVDPATGRLGVKIDNPKPHGLDKDAIVYAFEGGEPLPGNVAKDRQYLGEFRVREVTAEGATLDPVLRLDRGKIAWIDKSGKAGVPWSLYETMPTDSHELFAGLSQDDLKKIIPPQSVEEYLREGTDATEDDDEFHRAGYDESGARVGPEAAAKDPKSVAAWKYDRQLRDYAYLFTELAREKTLKLADRDALTEDVAKLKKANEAGLRLTALRTEDKRNLGEDLDHMKRDRSFIEALGSAVEKKLAAARKLLAQAEDSNLSLERDLIQRQMSQLPAAGVGASEVLLNQRDF